MAKRFQELGVKAEIEVFEAGDIVLAQKLLDEGLFDGDPLFQFVLGINYNAPANAATMNYLLGLLPDNAIWGALGTGRNQFPIVAQSALLGGNVRVGLEDNLYLRKGEFATNGQLVARAAELLDILGRPVATVDQARHMLGLKARRN
ncbi:MAG: 3-keto-5-aminohexanoate cleavage protein [Bacteroidota bacterium]